jgi:hypothetical protein
VRTATLEADWRDAPLVCTRARVSRLSPELEAEIIWRRISSIDGVDEVTAGSWSPSTFQSTFGLGVRGFNRCERFVPQGGIHHLSPIYKMLIACLHGRSAVR